MKQKDESEVSANESSDFLNSENIYKSFKENKIENSNVIIDLLKELEESDTQRVRKAFGVLLKIFCLLLKDGDIKEISQESIHAPKHKYAAWLYDRYLEVHGHYLQVLSDKASPLNLRDMALLFILKLIQKESLHPVTKEKVQKISFPIRRLQDFYKSLLFSENVTLLIEKRLKDTLRSPDFLFVSLHALADIVTNVKEDEVTHSYQSNLLDILQLIHLPQEGKKPLKPPPLFISKKQRNQEFYDDTSEEGFPFPYEEGKKLFNRIWEAVLHFHFTPVMYKRCLILLPSAMKNLVQPVRLTDFFMNAYNLGGVHSLLAMHGVYILVTQYNLEYPDFYVKVYALLTPDIFLAKYRSRFFDLFDKFFLSPYIPEYIAAAVIKRCCRLMLTAPSPCLTLLIRFVANMLLRFPSLKKLINSPNATSISDDPYIEEETNLLKSRATESSLWEIDSLRRHPLCGIAKEANFITRNVPDIEHELSRHYTSTYEQLYQKAKKIKEPRVATTFYKPEGLFKYSDDTMSSTWEVM